MSEREYEECRQKEGRENLKAIYDWEEGVV